MIAVAPATEDRLHFGEPNRTEIRTDPRRLINNRPRAFAVDAAAPDFYAFAIDAVKHHQWTPAELYRQFVARYGRIVAASSFYRWCEARLEKGIAPAPHESEADITLPVVHRTTTEIDPDAPELQSQIILDLALRLPRDEIDLLDTQLSKAKTRGSMTVPEMALLRAVRGRMAFDRATEGEAHTWAI